MSVERDVVVFLETSGETKDEVNGGLLTEGYRLATGLGGHLSAIAVGVEEPDTGLLERCCVSRLYSLGGEELLDYSSEVFAWVTASAIREVPFRLLLFAHSDQGRDIAPRVASYLDTIAITDCVDIRIRNEELFFVRSVYGDQFEQESSYPSQAREIASFRIEFLEKRELSGKMSLEKHNIRMTVPKDLQRTRVVETTPPDYRTVDILHAKRIIGIGSGCGHLEVISLAEELSHLLEGSLGTTRPVVDEGVLPKDRMIGQTGKTVSPDAYLALGISGSPHHVAGIQRSRSILTVNRDPRAPIFSVADAGFVCDLRTLLPKLIDRIKRFRDQGSS
jgi:electron transfer flavoprotein alpha subunit